MSGGPRSTTQPTAGPRCKETGVCTYTVITHRHIHKDLQPKGLAAKVLVVPCAPSATQSPTHNAGHMQSNHCRLNDVHHQGYPGCPPTPAASPPPLPLPRAPCAHLHSPSPNPHPVLAQCTLAPNEPLFSRVQQHCAHPSRRGPHRKIAPQLLECRFQRTHLSVPPRRPPRLGSFRATAVTTYVPCTK